MCIRSGRTQFAPTIFPKHPYENQLKTRFFMIWDNYLVRFFIQSKRLIFTTATKHLRI